MNQKMSLFLGAIAASAAIVTATSPAEAQATASGSATASTTTPAATTTSTTTAGSGRFYDSGTLIISADRMFGLNFWSRKDVNQNPPNPDITTKESGTQFQFLWSSEPTTPYNIPRVSIDYTVIPNLTIGGSIGFFTLGSKNTKEQPGRPTVDTDGPTYTAFLIAPRAGYIIGLSDSMGIWLRGGFTYFSISQSQDDINPTTGAKTTDKDSTRGFALDLEPTFVISPVAHFGFYGGLFIDLPLSGTRKRETVVAGGTTSKETDRSFTNVGLTFGLLGYI